MNMKVRKFLEVFNMWFSRAMLFSFFGGMAYILIKFIEM